MLRSSFLFPIPEELFYCLTGRDIVPMLSEQLIKTAGIRHIARIAASFKLGVFNITQQLIYLLVVVSHSDPLQCVDKLQLESQFGRSTGVKYDLPHLLLLDPCILLHELKLQH